MYWLKSLNLNIRILLNKIRFIDKKRIIASALILVVGLSFAIVFAVNGKNAKARALKEQFETIERGRYELQREAHIREMQEEDTKTRVEKMTRVGATISTGTRVKNMESPLEEPVEEPDEEEENAEEEIVEEETQEEEETQAAEEPEEDPEEDTKSEKKAAAAENNEYYSSSDLQFMGEIYSGGYRWTWYSQNVLPGGGLDIPGRHVDENGYVCDENDRICLASTDYGYGTVVPTPFGKEGCVYDSGCDSGTLDVYVDF